MMIKKGDHVFLIDGSGFIFRAFYALPPLSRPSDGLPVGAVHGFCNMLWRLVCNVNYEYNPTHIAVIFDHPGKTFRNDIYPEYKAHRPSVDGDLVSQFPIIRDATKAFNIMSVEMDGYEADDLIATYSRQVAEGDGYCTIVTSDKDMMQLIRPGVVMFDPIKGKNIGPAEVVEKFGLGPEHVIDIQALAGDSVDNIPGVPGVGIKTAAQLISEYGDLDMALVRADEIKQPKRREAMMNFAEQARLSKDLVTLFQYVETTVGLDEMAIKPPIKEDLLAFMAEMEFISMAEKVSTELGWD